MSQKVFDKINRLILDYLDVGVVPWAMPWRTIRPPRNLLSGKPYRGINLALLCHHEYDTSWFLTYKQARNLGGYVRRGEEGFPVVFWGWVDKKDTEDEAEGKSSYPLMRTYTVFNVQQCEGLKHSVPEENTQDIPPLERAEELIKQMPMRPKIRHGGDRACYRSLTDEVIVPARKRFNSSEEYYSTLFHELVHSTGHKRRVGRVGIENWDSFGSEQYSKEELIAEMGAAYLCSMSGIKNTIESSAAYIDGWFTALNKDKRLIFQASSAAQKAVDFILDQNIADTHQTTILEAA